MWTNSFNTLKSSIIRYSHTSFSLYFLEFFNTLCLRGHRDRHRIVVGFTTTYAISAYHHWSCEFETRLWRGLLDTTSCDKVCQWLVTGQCFSPGTRVSSTNKTDHHDISEILLNVVLNTINLNLSHSVWWGHFFNTCMIMTFQVLVSTILKSRLA